jgi:hypothetical protein
MTIATTGQLPTEANAFVNLALPYVLVWTLSVHRSAAKARAGLVTKIFVATASPTSRSIAGRSRRSRYGLPLGRRRHPVGREPPPQGRRELPGRAEVDPRRTV